MTVATESWQPVHKNHKDYLPWSEFKDYHAKPIQYEFKRMHNKINSLIKNMNHQFKQVNHEFKRTHNKIDSGFAQVDCEFAAVKMTMSNLSVTIHNSKISQLHKNIKAIQTFDPSSDLNSTVTPRLSEGFSIKVNIFLNISDDSKLPQPNNYWFCLLPTVPLLTKLCQFYNVNWQSWENSFDLTSS